MSWSRVACVIGVLALLPGCPLGGLERADALCAKVTCDTPPPPVCVEPGVMRHARPDGRCRLPTGLCEYPFDETPCPLGCFDSQRCRREGDELARVRFVDRWALTPPAGAVLVDLVAAPGCDAGVYEARPMSPQGLEGAATWQSGCAAGYPSETPVWPMVSDAGVVVGFEGKKDYFTYAGGLWLPGEDGGIRVEPRPGRPSLALDDSGGVFWAAFDVAVALTARGEQRWERPCVGLCGSKSEGSPGLAMVVPGRAYVSCRSGCTAFTPDGELLFARPSANSGASTELLLTDSPDRALVGRSGTGLEALSWAGDGGYTRFFPTTPPESLWIIAAVVEQRGTVLLAWNATVSQGGRILSEKYYLSRLSGPGLVEQSRVEVGCRPSVEGMVARRDGSVLVAMMCKPESAVPGPAIWVFNEALEVTARLPLAEYTLGLGPLSVDEQGNIWAYSTNTLVVLTGTQPPAESPWPMVRADAQNTRRARFR